MWRAERRIDIHSHRMGNKRGPFYDEITPSNGSDTSILFRHFGVLKNPSMHSKYEYTWRKLYKPMDGLNV